MWERLAQERFGSVRRLYHLWKLQLVIGSGHHSIRDTGEYLAAERRQYEEDSETRAVYGSLALMPVVELQRDSRCADGHRMFARTIPLPDHEKIVVLGCDGDDCPMNMRTRLREFALDYGVPLGAV